MPLVEVQPRAEVAAGTYEAVVSNVEKDIIVPRTGRNAGQDVPILRWNFIIDGVDDRIESITGRDPSSEKSNLFKYFVAVLGSDKKAWMDAETEDLVGKKCLVTISITDDGSGTDATDWTLVDAAIGPNGRSRYTRPWFRSALFQVTPIDAPPARNALKCSVASVSGPEKSPGPIPNGFSAKPATIGVPSASGANSGPTVAPTN